MFKRNKFKIALAASYQQGQRLPHYRIDSSYFVINGCQLIAHACRNIIFHKIRWQVHFVDYKLIKVRELGPKI